MLTRCPACETTFRVTPEQLRTRQGRVRCGACQNAFNALDSLIEEIPAAATARPAPATKVAPPLAQDEPAVPAATAEADFVEVGDSPSEATEAPTASPDATVEPETQPAAAIVAEPAAEPELPVAPVSSTQVDPAAQTGFLAEAKTDDEPAPEAATLPWPELEPLLHEAPRPRFWIWGTGLIVALLFLAAQGLIRFRTEIAVTYPEIKPTLAAACASLGCKMLLPRKPELVAIEASDLHPADDGKLTLAATLKNRASFAQEFPHLELALTDTADRPLVRRVLDPAAYLPPGTHLAAGFGANSELAVTLVVEAPGVAAAGYRLYVFYP